MAYLKFSIGIFFTLALSRFIPHPPNFTSLLALSFYIPVLLGMKFLPALLISFVITDFIIGLHGLTLFTWGSIILIGLMSKFFRLGIKIRILGALMGACLFYLITNFGVWSLGSYGYTLKGLINCYLMAVPFFTSTILSTLIFSLLIEFVYYIYNSKFNFFSKSN